MLRRIIVVALLALSALGLTAATASPAQAGERCHTPQVLKFDTVQVCIFLPEIS